MDSINGCFGGIEDIMDRLDSSIEIFPIGEFIIYLLLRLVIACDSDGSVNK